MDWILWILICLFVCWELYARFVARNRGAHTLSNRIQTLERRYPKTRVLTAVALLVLALHLTVGWI